MALVRVEETGRSQAPLAVWPQAPQGVRVRPGLLRGSWVKSAHKTCWSLRGAGGCGVLVSEVMLQGGPGRSYS